MTPRYHPSGRARLYAMLCLSSAPAVQVLACCSYFPAAKAEGKEKKVDLWNANALFGLGERTAPAPALVHTGRLRTNPLTPPTHRPQARCCSASGTKSCLGTW